MNPEPDRRIDHPPADLETYYAPGGSLAAAQAWVELVLDGRLGEAWTSTGSLFRLALTRYWCWCHRFELHRAGHDPLELAAALADDGAANAMWPAFARSQRPPESAVSNRAAGWVAAGPPEPVGPDLEVVQLASVETAGTDSPAPTLALILRLGPTGWLVVGHGRTPVQPRWPPVH